MKLCKDCKHYFRGYVRVRGWAFPVIGDNCEIAVKKIDPVDGVVEDLRELIDCREHRAEISHIENKCGPDGKHFEAS
jgi:hypothetical protein